MGRLRGCQRRWKLGHDRSLVMSLLNMFECGVVMTCQANIVRLAIVDKIFTMRGRVLSLQLLGMQHFVIEFLLAPALLAHKVNTSLLNIFPLPLPWCVIH